MGEDIAKFRSYLARSHSQSGFYDVMVHADSNSFYILEKAGGKEVWREVSVKEVADIVRPKLAPGDKIRLFACEAGSRGGPAQKLSNELGRTVWAPNTKLPATPKGKFTERSFVPLQGGKFYEFVPERGAAHLAGNGGKVTGNKVHGTIKNAR